MQRGESAMPLLGLPVSFISGPLHGLTVRIALEEIQKADIGRKYASKDKRPLDPPPVVQCHFYSIPNTYSPHPSEDLNELDVETMIPGAVCHVDLFSIPEDYAKYITSTLSAVPTPAPPTIPSHANAINPALVYPHPPGRSVIQTPTPPLPPSREQFSAALSPTTLPPFSQLPIGPEHHAPEAKSSQTSGSNIVAWLGSFPIREASKCTSLLAGVTFTQAQSVDYNGKRAAMFVYSDLAVRAEGTFILRYRALHVASQIAPTIPFRILAECYGGPFKIYSTKTFPGLPPSTALTRLLSLHNVRVNIRETERKRRKKSEMQEDHTEPASKPNQESDGDSDGTEPCSSQPHSPVVRTRHSDSPTMSSTPFSASGSLARSRKSDEGWPRFSATHSPKLRREPQGWSVERGGD
ncbi:velvet factor-domain-containing protein [Trametes gibbosa]|nr:velvet factor-domain-containing protein [Trametes gibbosa]